MWFGLQFSIVEKLYGIVILFAKALSFDFKNINDKANKAAGAVTCVFTVLPSII
jgi:hypothetical protein